MDVSNEVAKIAKLPNGTQPNSRTESSQITELRIFGDYAYRREDGIYIVPVTTLKD